MVKDTEFRSAEIVQSTEHSIVEMFVRPGGRHKEDLTGRLEIRIDHPTSDSLRISLKNDGDGNEAFDVDFLLCVEGAAALQTALMQILNWREDQVQETKMAADAPEDEVSTSFKRPFGEDEQI